MNPITIEGITYETIDHTETETLTLVSFDAEGGHWDIAVLVSEDREPYTTSDWQGEQPKTIKECPDFDWVRASDWVFYDYGARDVLDSITSVLGN